MGWDARSGFQHMINCRNWRRQRERTVRQVSKVRFKGLIIINFLFKLSVIYSESEVGRPEYTNMSVAATTSKQEAAD